MEFNSTSVVNITNLKRKSRIIQEDDHMLGVSMASSVTSRNHDEEAAAKEPDENITTTLAKKETRVIFCFRCILALVLITVTVLVSTLVYYITHYSEVSNFEFQFTEHANKLADAFRDNAKRRLHAIESFSVAITSHALSSGEIWPYVTFPDFERRAYYVMDLAEILSISFVPIVSTEERSRWEKYSVLRQGWFEESLKYQKAVHGSIDEADAESENQSIAFLNGLAKGIFEGEELTDSRIPDGIFRLNGTTTAPEINEGPYAVWWQFAPVFPFANIVNLNVFSNPSRTEGLTQLLKTEETVVGDAMDITDHTNPRVVGRKAVLNLFLNRWKQGGKAYQDGPISDLYVPVFDQFYETNPNNRSMKGILTSYIYWQVYFEDILPENAHGVMAVLENTCNQTYSYLIHGHQAKYIGPGDLHESTFEHLEVSTGFGAFLQTSDQNHHKREDDEHSKEHENQCIYNVRVYPTKEMQDMYLTNAPRNLTMVVAGVFFLTAQIFKLYAYFVERRQKLVMKAAVQSTQVVNSLFPAQVRDRLYEVNEKNKAIESNHNTMLHFKRPHAFDKQENETDTETDTEMAVIADLYENCTVLFADIAGFTNWCSNREPAKVFRLLEAIYGAFDAIAKKRRVFKIETIGDCYLAVTGVPEPQKDHAIIMCKFAIDCMVKVEQLFSDVLVPKLGPDTAKLQMRFGLHSGPITGGVLRGDRARFQLFGDTVNTASRMESNGKPGKIHLSESTAQLLVNAGKSSWIAKREDLIEAKGKGTLQTYWLERKFDGATSISTSSS